MITFEKCYNVFKILLITYNYWVKFTYPYATAAHHYATAAHPYATAAHPYSTAAYHYATAAYPYATAAHHYATAAHPRKGPRKVKKREDLSVLR